jgi:hypothetical protein
MNLRQGQESESAMPPSARPEFQRLTETEVMTALDNPDSQNAIALEVGRLVAAYALELCDRSPLRASLQDMQCFCAIETVALRLAARLAGLPVVKDVS